MKAIKKMYSTDKAKTIHDQWVRFAKLRGFGLNIRDARVD